MKLELALAAVLLTALTGCGGSGAGTLRVGTLSDSKPNAYSEGGKFTGFDNELLRAIADRKGLKLEFASTDFSTLLGQVANGQFDIGSAGISQTDARKKTVDFSNGYNYQALGIEAAPGSPVTDENSLAGKRIGVVQGTISDTWLTATAPAAQVTRFPNDAAVVSALNAGSLDGAVFDKASAEQYAAENPGLEVTKSLLTNVPHGYAVRKGNGQVLSQINDGLRQVIADGTWLRLHRHFEPNEEVPTEFKGNG
ncbi:MAG TPA: ABC transporter substrate-binding protein [Amycolatopsis sp.]|uniref:ABC transporter substrate-binding protein n=1 Tax=Amycolatopsis sp. TaxID=37632 RepID=UPI002B49ADAC|nr:ABC transporter substrate-binding protein [Amycolatopsis sp.]HKS45559.1 ABC transporter substrate-binding protein [Amycolatopsis sp.]